MPIAPMQTTTTTNGTTAQTMADRVTHARALLETGKNIVVIQAYVKGGVIPWITQDLMTIPERWNPIWDDFVYLCCNDGLLAETCEFHDDGIFTIYLELNHNHAQIGGDGRVEIPEHYDIDGWAILNREPLEET